MTNGLLWFSIISTGIMAGVYFTFSAFVMRALDEIEAPAGMLAMQSINRVIVNSAFLPLFFLSTIASVVLCGLALFDLGRAGAFWLLSGSTIYVLGMFVVTIAGNVPLNNRLEATVAAEPEGADMWRIYLRKWKVWNHVRTACCTISMGLLVTAATIRM